MNIQRETVKKPKVKKREFKIPHIIAILFIMMIIAMVATWLVPAGQYTRVPGPDKRMIVDPESFKFIASKPVGLFKLFTAIPDGMTQAGMIAFTILIIGGAWEVINATGAISVGVDRITKKLRGRETLAIPLLMLLFATISAFIGALELSIVYVPVIIPLALALGFDTLTAVAMALVAANGAFSASLTNPFVVGLGQSIAGLPLYSGIGYRLIVLLAFTAVGILYVMLYARKVKANPLNSLVYEENLKFAKEFKDLQSKEKEVVYRKEHGLIGFMLIAGLGAIIYGVLKLQWFMYEIGAIFFILAVVIGLIGRLSIDTICEKFVEGCKSVILAAVAVGLARSILVIVEAGQITDTIIMGLVMLVKSLPSAITVVGIFLAESIFNFVVSSGSGLTLITMPILAPLSDIVGITRQTTVLATQLGDGITNIYFPVSGILMACIAYAKVPYSKWLKFITPLMVIWTVMGAVFLIIAQAIKWGPF